MPTFITIRRLSVSQTREDYPLVRASIQSVIYTDGSIRFVGSQDSGLIGTDLV